MLTGELNPEVPFLSNGNVYEKYWLFMWISVFMKFMSVM